MFVNMARYPIFVRNDETCAVPTKNGSFYNRVHRETIIVDLKQALLVLVPEKSTVINLDIKILMNLILQTPFHSVIIIKLVPQY